MAKEEGKLDIEDIKDPMDEIENKSEDVDLEEVVSEDTEDTKKALKKPEELTEDKEAEDEPKKDGPEKIVPSKTERAVEEEKSVDSAAAKEPKSIKPKKPFPWKTVAIVVVTVIVTAALILGGYYIYQKNYAPKPADTDVAPTTTANNSVNANVTPQQKTVYTTAEPTLNLRQEPSTSSTVLAKIPFGAQLTVLATQNTWYKVTYSGQTGWIDSTYTQANNPLIYKNTDYGFQITFLADWFSYKFFPIKNDSGSTAAWYVALPTTDQNHSETGVDKGYASMFALTVYTPDQWKTISAAEGPKPTIAVQNQQWVITYSLPNGTPPTDLATQAAETKQVVAAIKFY